MSYVYVYGMIAASTVYQLDKQFSYPKPNQYAEISKVYPSIGGEAANTAIMFSKLGISTKLDGIWINEKHKEKIFKLLGSYGIDHSRLSVKTGNVGCEEIVISDQNSRTVFGNYAAFHRGLSQCNIPQEEDIKNARYVALDPYFKSISNQIAQICVKNKIPYVDIDCKYEDFQTQHAEAVIISHELRDQAYPNADLKEIFMKYKENCKGLIIFSFGEKELWYGRKGELIKIFKPFKITPIDTSGAGDSFRAGIIYGLMNHWDDFKTVEFASAVSACVCLSIPHTLNARKLDKIFEFIENSKK